MEFRTEITEIFTHRKQTKVWIVDCSSEAEGACISRAAAIKKFAGVKRATWHPNHELNDGNWDSRQFGQIGQKQESGFAMLTNRVFIDIYLTSPPTQ